MKLNFTLLVLLSAATSLLVWALEVPKSHLRPLQDHRKTAARLRNRPLSSFLKDQKCQLQINICERSVRRYRAQDGVEALAGLEGPFVNQLRLFDAKTQGVEGRAVVGTLFHEVRTAAALQGPEERELFQGNLRDLLDQNKDEARAIATTTVREKVTGDAVGDTLRRINQWIEDYLNNLVSGIRDQLPEPTNIIEAIALIFVYAALAVAVLVILFPITVPLLIIYQINNFLLGIIDGILGNADPEDPLPESCEALMACQFNLLMAAPVPLAVSAIEKGDVAP